ncbi:MAG: hypothetical protein IIB66_01910 [Proteobacteria bacterium]|nr:hypothetical protein [Pseudomonadota bacterium]
MPRAKSEAEVTAEADAKWWNEEWLKFPTVSLDDEGKWHYWDVTEDSRVYSDDRALGEALARDTVAQMQRFPEGGSVLRRIMREIDRDSIVAQGFFNRLEDMLIKPEVYLESLEPGSVQAKLRGA